MQLRELLPRLSGVRKGWQGYAAKCPAHDDKRQSLSLSEGDGRILVKCFAGCSTETIVGQLGLTWKDLFDREITMPSVSSLGESMNETHFNGVGWSGVNKSKGKVHAIYPYTDEEGRLLYENVRYHPKGFRQRRFDVSGQPVWNLEGIRRVPYRLPELIEAAKTGKDIFLSEGEKDADALRELGFTASSFKNWTEDFNQFIQGSHVILCQDHDIPGITQANEAARIILRSAASVKILDMFQDRELPEKHGLDISDYIRSCVEAEGAEPDTLKERISLAVEYTPAWKDAAAARPDEYFRLRTAKQRMELAQFQPTPRQLFGDFWFEGEVCILFADTNVGKSILAVQIADAISRGVDPDESGTCKTTVAAQKVVYMDFELTEKQFQLRFSEKDEATGEYSNPYPFHSNFCVADINPDTADLGGFAKFEDFLNNALETTIVSSGAKVLIVDNLTYLRDETENARNALPLMKYLKGLKSKYGLSILALAHTPKRDASKPIGRNDLQGSKMIVNFCDSAFAIGESAREPGLRYLKQIKARNTEIVYHAENVLMARIEKDTNFLRFKFAETAFEVMHLKAFNDQQRSEAKNRIKELRERNFSLRKIAEMLNLSPATVHRYAKEMSVSETGEKT